MPISRFLEWLLESGNLQAYMEQLTNSFNPAAVVGLMCRNTLSVSWNGTLHDCDFNQMLGLPLRRGADKRVHLSDLLDDDIDGNPIRVAGHCYGCTAGQGSSCGGALKEAAE